MRKNIIAIIMLASAALVSCGNSAKQPASPTAGPVSNEETGTTIVIAPRDENSTEEPSAPTEMIINPTEEVSVPTEMGVNPTEEASVPTKTVINPTEEVTAPTETEVNPTKEAIVPTETVAAPTEEAVTPIEETVTPTKAPTELSESAVSPTSGKTEVAFDESWRFADSSAIHSGASVLYRAASNRKNIVIGVNAGHGTVGGTSAYTYCHPDRSAKITGGSTAAGSIMAVAVSGGMIFNNGLSEPAATLKTAVALKDKLLAAGYDVLMVRDGDDVQLDNVARTVMCNNNAACHIAIHFDGDTLSYDKGCYYISVPDGLKTMDPVSGIWQESEKLGAALLSGLQNNGAIIYGSGVFAIDLTQTSYSTVPSVDVELGNQCTVLNDEYLDQVTKGLLAGIEAYFG